MFKDASIEYPEIEAKVASGFKCNFTLFAMKNSHKVALRLRMSEPGSVTYYDFDEASAEILSIQLADAIQHRRKEAEQGGDGDAEEAV